MSQSMFAVPAGAAFDTDHPLWAVGSVAKLWDGEGWKVESLSWKESCYIHAGLSGPGQIRYSGPDAARFLESVFVNNFSRFKVGTAKHAVACTDAGPIAGHGVLQRTAEDDFRLFVSGQWVPYRHSLTDLEVTQEIQDNYLFQVAGPHSRTILAAAANEPLADVGFLRFKDVVIGGHRCEIMRIGMAGTLAYELHGPIAEGPAVYDAVRRAGAPHGIVQLGWKTYHVNHVEGGFPQQTWTFLPATYGDEAFMRFVPGQPTYRVGAAKPLICGSVDPADMRARYRTPRELGWERSVVFDHDFIGRDSLERDMASSGRTIVTLEWNDEDVLDVAASFFRAGEPYKAFDMPATPQHVGVIGHADHVMKDGRPVGIASGVAYSYYFRKMLSHCTIEAAEAAIGNEVVVRWGDFGGPMKDIRATVARYPYLSEKRNQEVER